MKKVAPSSAVQPLPRPESDTAPLPDPALRQSRCGVCGQPTIGLRRRLLASIGARQRCSSCGAAQRTPPLARWVRLPLDVLAFGGVLWLVTVIPWWQALVIYAIALLVPSALALYLPLEPDPRDPLTRRALARQKADR